MGFSGEGDPIFLLGQTREELCGSEWAHVTHRHLGGAPPAVDLAAEQRLAALLAEAASAGHLTAAHDLSDGGLAQALVESCLRRNMGAHVALPSDGQSPFVHLFSESSARVLVSVRKGQEQAFAALADAAWRAAHRARHRRGQFGERRRAVRDRPRRTAPGPHRHPPRPVRLTCRERTGRHAPGR